MLRKIALIALLSPIALLKASSGPVADGTRSTAQAASHNNIYETDRDKASNLYVNITMFLDTGNTDCLVHADANLENGAKPYLQFELNKDGVDIRISVNEALLYLEQDLKHHSFNHYDFDTFKTTSQEKPSCGAILNQFISQGDSQQRAAERAHDILFTRFLATGKLSREGQARLATVKTMLEEHERKAGSQARSYQISSQEAGKSGRRTQPDKSGIGGGSGRPPRRMSNLVNALFLAGAAGWCYFLYQRFIKTDKETGKKA